jgi:hypothetical protein
MNSNTPKNIIVTKTKIDIPLNCDDLSLVFYKQTKSSDPKEVLYAREVIKVKSKFGPQYDFYSVSSSRYGVRIPKTATHWCIAFLGTEPKALYSAKIPDEMTMHVIDYAEDSSVYFNRFGKNVKFMIGASREKMRSRQSKNKPNPKLKLISELLN